MGTRTTIGRSARSIVGTLYSRIYRTLPEPPKPPKGDAELRFWKSRWEIDHGDFHNSHFRRVMLAMAEEEDDRFLRGKIVGDFGCGPRGSLVWAQSAALRIGIDVLADTYADLFTASIVSHGMVYVKSTERVIPLPSDFLDVLFTLNAVDHVDDLELMCREMLRVLKPGGVFIGSFNLQEPPTGTEPQCLTEELVQSCLLDYLDVDSYRTAQDGPEDDQYKNLIENNLAYEKGQHGYLWVRAHKKPAGR